MPRQSATHKRTFRYLIAAFVCGLAAMAMPGCGARYIVVSAYYQAELLSSRQPVEKVLENGGLSAGEEQRLRLFAEVKSFGKDIGLSATHNYDTYARTWDRTIWNVCAAPPLSFEPKTWWFPIVGTVPYLGYFTEAEAQTQRIRLEAEGYEVYMRTVAAYSTLGWFRDPILPQMLRWDEPQIAETVSHELAHATLWIPGSVAFNESFASVVGTEAGNQYLAHKYGPESAEVVAAREGSHDWLVFQAVLDGLYRELDAVYRSPQLSDVEKTAQKAELYASLADRVRASTIRNQPRYLQAVRLQQWNNARLMQFRTYNSAEAEFQALLQRHDANIPAFIDDVRRITKGAKDPFAALGAAVR
jgi:predicted aminopeptidase